LKAYFDRAAFYLTCGSLISILFSIAVSQILLLSSERMRLWHRWLVAAAPMVGFGYIAKETVKVGV